MEIEYCIFDVFFVHQLPEVEIVDDGLRTLKLVHSDKSKTNFPMKLEAKTIGDKASWMELLTSKDSGTSHPPFPYMISCIENATFFTSIVHHVSIVFFIH